MYNIIDNFLEKNEYEKIKNLILSPEFPWRRKNSLTNNSEGKDIGYFTYSFFSNFRVSSNEFTTHIIPILNKLNAVSIIEARANLFIKEFWLSTANNYHIDYPNIKYNKTSILNFSTSEEGTLLKVNDKEIKIDSIENRLITMTGNIPHSTIKSKEADPRYILNLNYF
jgi:hypothetical protein|tara:strand:+ start:66 stop:569 length:504 start_codon:yes stop_codon:yes gene_type:complete